MPSDAGPNLLGMAKSPTRIDLLELDIDLRLTDLWREAGEVAEWNLEVVAAFMRAAYGKGYCDALTEDDPGSLCHEHGYRIPACRETAPACLSAATTHHRGKEAQPGAARDRALGRGRARDLSPLHLDRRGRHAFLLAERARGQDRPRRRLGTRRRPGPGAMPTTAGSASGCATSRVRRRPRCRSSTRAPCRTSSARAVTSTSRAA